MKNKTLPQILKLDYKSYDNYRFTCFIKWCNKFCEYGIPLQALITNKPLHTWYCQQWIGMVENAFKSDYKAYLEANISEPQRYLEILSSYPETLEQYYPSVIINMIKESLKPNQKNENIHQD